MPPTFLLYAFGVVFLIPFTFCYLIGSIPFGLILTKFGGYGDIQKIGSGNIGATNVLRTGNKLLAFLTLLLDSGKGAFTVFLYKQIIDSFQFTGAETVVLYWDSLLIGLYTILGHCFPIWLKFKGGKGVSTSLGVLLAATPLTGGIALATWVITFALFRISSLAALTATLIAPFVTLLCYGPLPAGIVALIALLIFARHSDNIKRLLKGEEKRMGKKE